MEFIKLFVYYVYITFFDDENEEFVLLVVFIVMRFLGGFGLE